MSLVFNIRRTLSHLLPEIKSRHETHSHTPIVLGVTGLQGSGKSTWSSHIVNILSKEHNLRTITVSLDDFYKTHDELIARREKDPENKLYRTRGQPGTHDEVLAAQFFEQVRGCGDQTEEAELAIPRFDKSRFGGEGDRVPESEWARVRDGIDVVVFEGWCVGFRALEDAGVKARYEAARQKKDQEGGREIEEEGPESTNTLADHRLEHLLEVNRNLGRYNQTFMGPHHFDFMIHIDTGNLKNVYRWRAQQEEELIRERGEGMSYDAVAAFVRGYMPAYELYLDGLREGFFGPGSGRQVRAILAAGRDLQTVETM